MIKRTINDNSANDLSRTHTNNRAGKTKKHEELEAEIEAIEAKLGVSNDGTWLKAPSGSRMGYNNVVSGTTARNTLQKPTLIVDTTTETGYRQQS